jgi:hypothetical protein
VLSGGMAAACFDVYLLYCSGDDHCSVLFGDDNIINYVVGVLSLRRLVYPCVTVDAQRDGDGMLSYSILENRDGKGIV